MKNLSSRPIHYNYAQSSVHPSIHSIDFQSFVEQIISSKHSGSKIFFVSSYSGAGKTQFCRNVYNTVECVGLIHLDHFGSNSSDGLLWLTNIDLLVEQIDSMINANTPIILIEGVSDNIFDVISSINPDELFFLHSTVSSFKEIMLRKSLDYSGSSDSFRRHWLKKSQRGEIWIRNFILGHYLELNRFKKTRCVYNDINAPILYG